MDKIPILDKLKVFSINNLRELTGFMYYLSWILLDPKKFVKIRPEKIKNLLVITGGAVGDIYNIIGLINSTLIKYPIKVYILTPEKNKKFIKNPKIKLISLDEAKLLIDESSIDAAILIDPSRERAIFDKGLFFRLLKIPYITSTDSIKLSLGKIRKQYFPILASRKVYPIRANGPMSLLKLFNLLNFKIARPTFYFTKKGEEFAKNFFKKNFKKSDKVVIIHPCAGKIVKALNEGKVPAHLWLEERWAELIDKILTDENIKIVITGIKSESVITEKVYKMVKNKKRVVYAVGKVPDIESLAPIVKRAITTVTLDTSMAHISSHVGTPAVILYGSDSPKRICPISNSKNIDIYHKNKSHDCRKYACKYCYNLHMKSISVKEVYSSAKKLILQES